MATTYLVRFSDPHGATVLLPLITSDCLQPQSWWDLHRYPLGLLLAPPIITDLVFESCFCLLLSYSQLFYSPGMPLIPRNAWRYIISSPKHHFPPGTQEREVQHGTTVFALFTREASDQYLFQRADSQWG